MTLVRGSEMNCLVWKPVVSGRNQVSVSVQSKFRVRVGVIVSCRVRFRVKVVARPVD